MRSLRRHKGPLELGARVIVTIVAGYEEPGRLFARSFTNPYKYDIQLDIGGKVILVPATNVKEHKPSIAQ